MSARMPDALYVVDGRDVPEVRYDVHGTAIHYEKPGRYRGLLAHEASALSDALYYDLPGSPCLLTLRKRWVDRAAWEAEDEATRVDHVQPTRAIPGRSPEDPYAEAPPHGWVGPLFPEDAKIWLRND